jgi:hypothetical protein
MKAFAKYVKKLTLPYLNVCREICWLLCFVSYFGRVARRCCKRISTQTLPYITLPCHAIQYHSSVDHKYNIQQ